MSFAEKPAKFANLGILDHEGPLLESRREPDSEQAGERRREFYLSLITAYPTTIYYGLPDKTSIVGYPDGIKRGHQETIRWN
jgi:hypothetical protein